MPFKYIFLFLPFIALKAIGQNTKIDNSPAGKLKSEIAYLASDQMAGRLTGSKEANQVADYIQSRFKALQLEPYKNKYQWDFTAKTGFRLGENAYFKIFDKKLNIGTEVIIFPYGSGNKISGMVLPQVDEPGNIWLISAKNIKLSESSNPQKILYEFAKEAIQRGAESVVFFNNIDPTQDISNLNLSKYEALSKPVAYINFQSYLNHLKPNLKKDWIDIDARLGMEDASTTGKNVVAMINNNAPLNIVIAANYDHIGFQGDVYNGADNNASGIAALLKLAEILKEKDLNRYNYIFIAFAGKEQDLQGSKAFLSQNEHMLNAFSCMINIDRVGRLNINKELLLSGIGTSPSWGSIVQKNNKLFKLLIDSSGLGYSDHNTFYLKQIPVLRISTGYHEDFMSPKDDVEKININGELFIINYLTSIIESLDLESKLKFNKTYDVLPMLEKTKNDLGIIPDYTFDHNGIRIDYCYANKAAKISGLKEGDVILKIGPFKIIDFDDYIEALNKTEKEKETTIIIQRDNIEFKFFATFQ